MGLPTGKRVCDYLALAFALHGFLAACAAPARAADVDIHYAPAENLERVDVDLLRSAHTKIDLAAYSLTDWPVIDALIDAHRRGVAVRIVLDSSQQHALDRLREITGSIRMKAPGPYMHLKSYAIDNRILRSGSANLSASGLKQQDNDLIIFRESAAAHTFKARFEQMWAGANPLPAPAISSRIPLDPRRPREITGSLRVA
jgi:phosphatidylserine/phosphatidylglycerophosphate/cardiolipin synthase-like enzyme